MTERTYSIQPPIATSTQSAFHVAATSHPRDAQVPAESIEEEPYTIKCICDYADDDGNTILCETCDTWQHIECYYHGNAEEASRDDFSHYCADCKPRFLDRRKATERQRKQREERPILDNGDKKSKRPQTKSHKKKPKPADLQTNGYHDHDGLRNGSPLEHSHKKSKSFHRSHHSISSQTVKHSPSHASRHHNHAHPLSPATTPPDDFLIQSYAKQLRDLYENDPGPQELQTNSIASISLTSTMSLWLRDPHKLRKDTDIDDPRDAFQMMKPEFDFAAHIWPRLQVNTKEIVANDAIIPLRYLSVLEPLKQHNALVGELKGFVGLQKDYYIEETDRFTKLCHPVPFVFFPPNLPLYIDTRREGSQCRYIRRSCRPNTTLDTYITNQSEYHFCVVNERPLAANEQITLAWDFKFKVGYHARYLQLLGLSDDEIMVQPEISESEYEDLTELIRNVLSEYGGCACGLESDCAFVRFHRNYRGKLHPHSNGTKPKKGRRPKHHISPTSTGHATNSRDASEGRQEMYDAEDDSRSTSGSVRSKPQSRDMTPFGDNGIEAVSEREKRKLENIERTFERLDQAQQPPKKKKRTSDGTVVTSPLSGMPPAQKLKQKPGARGSMSNATSAQANGLGRSYKDASTSRQLSNSPPNATSPTAAPTSKSRQASDQPSAPTTPRRLSVQLRANYSHASTQTEPSENTWYSAPLTQTPKKCFIPLSKRLFNSHIRLREEKRLRQVSLAAQMSNGLEQQSCDSVIGGTEDSKTVVPVQANVEMKDADSATAADSSVCTGEQQSLDVPVVDAPSLKDDDSIKSPPSPWPNPLNSVPLNSPTPPSGYRSVDLKVQMPPAQSLSNYTNPPPSGSITPSSIHGSVAVSPYGSVQYPPAFSPAVINSVGQHPSPVRKKLSFAAYSAMKKKNAEASSMNGSALGIDSAQTASAPHSADESASNTMQPPLSSNEDAVMTGILDGSAIVESPLQESVTDGLADAGAKINHSESATDTPSTSTQV